MYHTSAKQNDAEARTPFEQALKIDPNNVDAVAGLANTDLRDHLNGWADPGVDAARRGIAEAERALALDPNYEDAYQMEAVLLGYGMKPGDEAAGNAALALGESALRNNPSFAPAYLASALIGVNLGRYEQAVTHVQQAMRLSKVL